MMGSDTRAMGRVLDVVRGVLALGKACGIEVSCISKKVIGFCGLGAYTKPS